MSDTHNESHNIQKALAIFEKNKPELLIFCGDATTIASLEWFCEFPMIYVFGNGDFLTGEMQAFLKAYNPSNFAGYVFEGELGGKFIAVIHGHLEEKLNEIKESQDDNWQKIKSGFEENISKIKTSISQAFDNLKK